MKYLRVLSPIINPVCYLIGFPKFPFRSTLDSLSLLEIFGHCICVLRSSSMYKSSSVCKSRHSDESYRTLPGLIRHGLGLRDPFVFHFRFRLYSLLTDSRLPFDVVRVSWKVVSDSLSNQGSTNFFLINFLSIFEGVKLFFYLFIIRRIGSSSYLRLIQFTSLSVAQCNISLTTFCFCFSFRSFVVLIDVNLGTFC